MRRYACLLALLAATPALAKETPLITVEVVVEGGALAARLVNRGTTPLDVYAGSVCGGPLPVWLHVEGEAAPRVLARKHYQPCPHEAPLLRTLAPGAATTLRADNLLASAVAGRRVAVEYAAAAPGTWWQGRVRSEWLRLP